MLSNQLPDNRSKRYLSSVVGYTVIGFADIGKSNNGENYLPNRQKITLQTV